MNKNIVEQLYTGLVDILTDFGEIADKHGVSKELPRVWIDYWWLEVDEKGDGKGKSAKTLMPILYKAGDLIDQLIEKEEGISDKLITFGEKAKSVINDESFPAFTMPMDDNPLSIAKIIISKYIEEVESLTLNESVAHRISREFFDDITSQEYTASFVYLVQGFKAPKPFRLNSHIEFRPINDDDYKRFSPVESRRAPSHREPWLGSSDWICSIESTGDKSSADAFNSRPEIMEKIIGSLALTTSGRASFFFLLGRYKSRFFDAIRSYGGDYLYSSGVGGKVNLDTEGVKRFKNNFKLIESIFTNSKYKALRLPFRRFRLSSTRRDDNDKFVDYIIGLERLLAADSENLEVTFRFRLRGAALLPESFGKERKRISLMNKLYKIRSKIVHGSENPEQVSALLPETEKVFVAVFSNYAKLLSTTKGDKEITRRLDDALVNGGSSILKNADTL